MSERPRLASVWEEEDFTDKLVEDTGLGLDVIDEVISAIVGHGYYFAPLSTLPADLEGPRDA